MVVNEKIKTYIIYETNHLYLPAIEGAPLVITYFNSNMSIPLDIGKLVMPVQTCVPVAVPETSNTVKKS